MINNCLEKQLVEIKILWKLFGVFMEDEERDRRLVELLEQILEQDIDKFYESIIRMLDLRATSQDKQSPESCQTHLERK